MTPSNETRKTAGRPSLLSVEQQTALEQPNAAPVAVAERAGDAPRRKQIWLVAGLSVMAIATAFAFIQMGGEEQPAVTLAAAPAPAAAPLPAPATAPAATADVPATEAVAVAAAAAAIAAEAPAQAALPSAPSTNVAAIIDEAPAPAPVPAKPKESLAQMLESGVPPPAKAAAPKPVKKPVKAKPPVSSDKAIAVAAPEQDNDVELLAALVAHAKFDTSANARLSLPKALEQCKKQGKQDAARCRIRVCEGRWKKDECRAYSRSKLEKSASGA